MLKALMMGCLLLVAAQSSAEWAHPWEPGEDIEGFYETYCGQSDLTEHYFSGLSPEHRAALGKLLIEVLWADVSDYILGIEGSNTDAAVRRLKEVGSPVSPALVSMQLAVAQEPMRGRFVYAHNRNLEQREGVLKHFQALAQSDVVLAGAMLTYLDCRFVQNAKSLDPMVQSRIESIKTIRLPSQVPRAAHGGGYEGGSGCRCGSGNYCYGPRGGRFCITSGGNKDYR